MDKIKLSELGEIITGNTPSKKNKEFYNSMDICFFKPGDMTEDSIQNLTNSEEYISEKARNKARILPKGTILVTCIGTIGKIGIIEQESTCNQQINAIIPNEKVDPTYLAYLLYNKKRYLQKKANAPVVPIINKKDFSNIEVSISNKEQQIKIVTQLDKIQKIINIRKRQIEELDVLIKSQFVEMFGKIDERIKVKDCCSKITDYVASGSFASIRENVKYYDNPEYAIMVRTADFANNFSRNLTYTDKHGYDFLHNSNLFGGELLLSNIGASIGKVHRVPYLNVAMTLAPNAIMLKGNKKYLEDYLQYYFLSDEGQAQLKSMTTATAMPKFNKTQLKEIEIIKAPIELQNQFAEFVKLIDRQKFKIQKSLEETQKLQESLMNKYFR